MVRWVLVVLLLAGCEAPKADAPAAPPPPPAQAATDDVRARWGAAHAAVESLQKELERTEVAIAIYRENVLGNRGEVTTQATIEEAHERLPVLEKERAELEASLARARAEEARHAAGADAARLQGHAIRDECKENPLASGCSQDPVRAESEGR